MPAILVSEYDIEREWNKKPLKSRRSLLEKDARVNIAYEYYGHYSLKWNDLKREDKSIFRRRLFDRICHRRGGHSERVWNKRMCIRYKRR